MRNLFYIAAIAVVVTACSKNNSGQIQDDTEEIQNYTSFIISSQKSKDTLYRMVSGYFDNNHYCWKIAEHGNLTPNSTSETILDIDVDSIYIYYGIDSYYTDRYIVRIADPFIVKKNRKNNFFITDNTEIHYLTNEINKDSTAYPQ
jgi:hypothetical protein